MRNWNAIAVTALLLLPGAAWAQSSAISPATPPDERTPAYLPVVPDPPAPATGPHFTPAPVPQGHFSPPAAAGPVTNYGTGGMALPPGAPPNPAYPGGSLLH